MSFRQTEPGDKGSNVARSVCIVVPTGCDGLATSFWLDLMLENAAEGRVVTTVLLESKEPEDGAICEVLRSHKIKPTLLYEIPKSVAVGKGLLSGFESHYRVYEYLKGRGFDEAVFFDYRGLAFYCVVAKDLRLSLSTTNIKVLVVQPTLLNLFPSENLQSRIVSLGLAYMERRATELADIVVANADMFYWMAEGGYTFFDDRKIEIGARDQVVEDKEPEQTTMGLGSDQREEYPVVRVEELNFLLFSVPANVVEVYVNCLARYPGVFKRYTRINVISKHGSQHAKTFDSVSRSSAYGCEFIEVYSLSELEAAIDRNSTSVIYDPGLVNYGLARFLDNSDRNFISCYPARMGLDANQRNPSGYPSFSINPVSLRDAVAEAESNKRTTVTVPNTFANIGHKLPSDYVSRADDEIEITSPLVSICVVHHDRPKHLDRMLTSIANQDYENIEVIVCDDGSRSEEARIGFLKLKEKYDKRGWIFLLAENKWLGAARNYAALKSTGEFLVFVDDDNILTTRFVSTYVSCMLASDRDILTCLTYSFTEDDYHDYDGGVPDVKAIILPIGGAAALGAFDNTYGDASCIVKREVFEELGGYWEYYGLPKEDHDFYSRAASRGFKIEVVPEPLYYYRLSSSGMMSSNRNNCNFDFSANAIVSNQILMRSPSISNYELQALHLIMISQWYQKSRLYGRIPTFLRPLITKVKPILRKFIR